MTCIALALLHLPNQSDAKVGRSYWMEDLDDAYYDMGLGKGLDVTKAEWQVERIVKNGSKHAKNPNLNGKCTVRFLTSKSSTMKGGGNVALFSTGEVGLWRVVQPNMAPPNSQQAQQRKSLASCSYDEAVKSSSPSIEIEVLSDKPGDRSTVVYNFPMGSGSIQPLSVLVKTKGSVKYYPNGKTSPVLGMASEEYSVDSGNPGKTAGGGDGGIEVGSASMHIKGGKPLVDPAWAKGRRWFWTKREQSGMTNNPGYI